MLKVTIIDRSLFINMTVLPKSFKHSLLLIDRELFYLELHFQMSDVEAGGATVFPYVGARVMPSKVRINF